MALKAVHVSEVPNLDQVPESASFALYSSASSDHHHHHNHHIPLPNPKAAALFKAPKFLVIGHRGNGMNMLQSSDRKMKAIKENTILSFNSAANYPLDYIEFDVQVTKDGCPIIFHDDFIYSEENGMVYEKRVTDLSVVEFIGYGPQKEPGKVGKTLLRKMKDGRIMSWRVETDDSFCTLQEAFQKVPHHLGFNVELKFDDHIVYKEDSIVRILEAILKVVFQYADGRPIIFSSFHPDAALLVKKMQSTYPVFFLTNGGCEVYYDRRRNSLEDALQVCLEGGLQGIVSEVKGIFRNPGAVNKIKGANLSLITYGKLNNVMEAVYMQQLMGVEGVIVDFVEEITDGVSNLTKQSEEGEKEEIVLEGEEVGARPEFSKRELSFLLKLIPELLQQ